MATASVNSEQIIRKTTRKYKNVACLVVSNIGNNVAFVTMQGIKRPIAPIYNGLGAAVPVAPFKIDAQGFDVDVEITVDFEGGSGNAIIDTIQKNTCNNG